MKPKFSPTVYFALMREGLTHRRIGELLGVDEASVRRGLKGPAPREGSRVKREPTILHIDGVRITVE